MRLIAVLCLVASGLVSATAAAETIVDIHVEGLRRVDKEAALANIKLHKGGAFDEDAASSDLHVVWATGFFRDVRLEREVVSDGAILTFVVIEKPSVRGIKYVGRDALSEDDIKAVVDVKPFTILNTELLKRNVEKIRDLYVGKGYYLAEVRYRVEPAEGSEQEVNVVFEMVENAKVMVQQITFLGNKHLDDETIKGVLQTREGSALSFLTQSGTYKEEFFQTDMMRIQALYYDHGFVSVKVGEPTAVISKDRRYIYLTVPIEEGEQYSIGEIRFSGEVVLAGDDGQSLVDAASLSKQLTIAKGEVFNRSKLVTDIQTLSDVYRDFGYAFANVAPNSQVHAESRTVDLDLEVERGEMVHFERIEVSGNLRTRDKVIRRELRIFEGEKYSGSKLNLSRARIYQLGYFETVNITTSRGSQPHLMNATVEIKEKSTGTFQIGAGFSSVESFIATAQISQNNFAGTGQLLSLSMQLSFGNFARQLVQFQFVEPYFLDTLWTLGINAYVMQRYYMDFQRNAKGVAPTFGYPLTHELRLNWGYTFEYVELTTANAMYDSVRYNLDRKGIVSSVNAGVSYDTRDNRLFPTKGTFDELRGEWSSRYLGADPLMAFKRVELTLRYYFPIIWGVVFRANAQLGWVFGDGGNVPISERYFPGGIYSVRGYNPRGLGPMERVAQAVEEPGVETRDFIYGGNKQAVFNFELEFPIVPAANIRGVVFADAGNAFNENENMFYWGGPPGHHGSGWMMGSNTRVAPPLGLFYSFGFGFRWLSPIGPLRFEWGIPIIKHAPDDQPIIFEFTIGNFF